MLDGKASAPQPPPISGKIDVAPVVIADIEARVKAGKEKYGTLLQTHNGRSALWDLYQELIDACMYVRQRILEEEQAGSAPEHKPPVIEKVAESMKATAAYNCWVDRQGRFDASQTYVMPDLIMGVDDAIADLRRGKLVIVGINHVEKVRRRIEIEERDE